MRIKSFVTCVGFEGYDIQSIFMERFKSLWLQVQFEWLIGLAHTLTNGGPLSSSARTANAVLTYETTLLTGGRAAGLSLRAAQTARISPGRVESAAPGCCSR